MHMEQPSTNKDNTDSMATVLIKTAVGEGVFRPSVNTCLCTQACAFSVICLCVRTEMKTYKKTNRNDIHKYVPPVQKGSKY